MESEIISQRNDMELDGDLNPLLEACSNEELQPLVEILQSTKLKDFNDEPAVKSCAPNHQKYVDLISAHIRRLGGNTFANMGRGLKTLGDDVVIGPKYHKIVCTTAKQLKVNFKPSQPIEDIERKIFDKMFDDILEKMDEEQLNQLLSDLKVKESKNISRSAGIKVAQHLFRAGKFKSYQLAVIIVKTVSNKLLGKALPFAFYTGMTKTLSWLTGPIGMAVSTIWILKDIADPGRKYVVPCVLQIALLRMKHNSQSCSNCSMTMIESDCKFCPECGKEL